MDLLASANFLAIGAGGIAFLYWILGGGFLGAVVIFFIAKLFGK